MIKATCLSILLLGCLLASSTATECDECNYSESQAMFLSSPTPMFAFTGPASFLEDPATPRADVIQVCNKDGQEIHNIVQSDYELEAGCTKKAVDQKPCDTANGISKDQVWLWTEANYKGSCYTLENLSARGITFSDIKSIQIGPGIEKVRFLTHTHCDNIFHFSVPNVDLVNVAWKEVYFVHHDAVYLYSQNNFQGTRWKYTENMSNMDFSNVRSYIADDTIEGVKFSTQTNHLGDWWSYPKKKMASLHPSVSGKVKSLWIYRAVEEETVRLFTEPNFQGRFRDRSLDHDDLSTIGLDNAIKSVKLGSKVNHLVLYDDDDQGDGLNHVITRKEVEELPADILAKATSIELIKAC